MRCPRCETTLEALGYEGMLIQECQACGGEFVPGETLGEIVRTKREGLSDELREALSERTPLYGVVIDDSEECECPLCDRPMRLVNYGGDTGVMVDRCDQCDGVWLDSDELEKIQILQERWMEDAPRSIQSMAIQLESERASAIEGASGAFRGSRFSFINAVLNRILDAA
ncbi:MAG: zf-TFIIB domain-containing protein [Phycisphaerales bacterium JB043]